MAQVSKAQRVNLWFSSWLWTKTRTEKQRNKNQRKMCPETQGLVLFY